MNPRCTFAHYSLSRGAPSATWVLLHGTGQPMKFRLPGRETGGERGIRTPGTFRYHWFSRPAPSTARPSLLNTTSERDYSMFRMARQSFFSSASAFSFAELQYRSGEALQAKRGNKSVVPVGAFRSMYRLCSGDVSMPRILAVIAVDTSDCGSKRWGTAAVWLPPMTQRFFSRAGLAQEPFPPKPVQFWS